MSAPLLTLPKKPVVKEPEAPKPPRAEQTPAQKLTTAELNARVIEHSWLASLIGHPVEIVLSFGDRIEATVVALGKYSLIIETGGHEEIVFKHACVRISRKTAT